MAPRWLAHGLVVLVTISALALAGCTSDPEPSTSTDNDPVVVTDPRDRSALENESLANRSHLHDYWLGKESLIVLDHTESTGYMYSDPLAVASYRPEPGVVVPQGAASLDIQVAWEDTAPSNLYSRAELWVKTAATETSELVQEIGNGDTVTIASTNEDNDLPHQILSGWAFELVLHPDPVVGFMRYNGDVSILAVAHKGLDIPLYPPHPDQWNGSTEFLLFDDAHDSVVYTESLFGENCIIGCFRVHIPDDGVIVPMDASVVEVRLTHPGPSPTTAALRYHPSDSRDWIEIEPDETEGDTWVYRIHLLPGMGDGPYAKQSLWEFQTYLKQETVPFATFTGTYEIEGTVYREVVG